MKTVLVVGREWKFRALLRAELRERGFEAVGVETLTEAQLVATAPAVLVYDNADAGADEIAALAEMVARVPTIVVAGAQAPSAPSGVVVMRRPVQMSEIMKAVERLVGGAR
jgi:DNA-binding NtrC family response regulator